MFSCRGGGSIKILEFSKSANTTISPVFRLLEEVFRSAVMCSFNVTEREVCQYDKEKVKYLLQYIF